MDSTKANCTASCQVIGSQGDFEQRLSQCTPDHKLLDVGDMALDIVLLSPVSP